MLASFLIKPGTIELREIATPEPSEGEILVRIKSSLTCGTDLKAFLRGHPMIPMPGLFGHEFSGVVADVGKRVKKFRAGDGIMAVHSAPCNKCIFCKKGLYNLCENIMSTKVLGAFAEYILLPAYIVKQNVFHKPDSLSFEEAAFLEPLSCVVHGMEPLGIKEGDSALILGSGPIGLLHICLAKSKGARVLITGMENKRLKVAKQLGAEFAVRPENLNSIINDFTKGTGVDYVFECTGEPDVWEASVNYVRKGGTIILFGGCKGGTTVTYDTGRLHYDEITLKGVFHFTPDDVKKAYYLLKDGKIKVEKLISGIYSLKDLCKAFQRLINGDGIKYAIIP
ncbi:MAG: zinc-binding dehydrogenase [Nitrospirota bacterium]